MQKGEEGIWVDNIKGKIAMRNNQEGNEYQHKGDEGGKREGVSKKEKVKVLKKKKLLQKMNPNDLISCERNDVMNFSM